MTVIFSVEQEKSSSISLLEFIEGVIIDLSFGATFFAS